MKTGVLTLALKDNYGGILQAYALQTVLRNRGHEAILIKESEELPLWKMPFSYSKRILDKYIVRKENAIDVFCEQKREKLELITCQNIRKFIDEYIRVENMACVRKNKKDFDAIVVGSDQIWRPKYYRYIESAYLSFAKNWKIKRIAYAASFGTDQWEYTNKQTQNCKSLIKKFDAVSVREKSGVDLCKKHFDIKALHALDPTLLLDVSHYISLIEKGKVEKSKGDLFVYVLDKNEDTNKIEQKISSIFEYAPFYSSIDNKTTVIKDKIAIKIEAWLRSFYDAEFVLTDSFHACAFSILFNKPFVVYGNAARGMSRFESLLQLFNLEDRMISPKTVNLEQILNTPINWSKVNGILKEQREISNQFLINSLEIK
jgi:hypothetical protein